MSVFSPAHTKSWLAERIWWSDNWATFMATVDLPRTAELIARRYGLDKSGQPSWEGVTLEGLARSRNLTPHGVKQRINMAKAHLESPAQPVSVVMMRLPHPYDPPIEHLPLSKRLINLLKRRVKTLNELLALTEEEVCGISGIGPVILQELTAYLDNRGLQLAQPVP